MGTMTSFKMADEISRNLAPLPVITINFKIYFHSHALIVIQAPTINTPLTYTLPFVWIPYITVLAIMVFSWKWKGKPLSTKLAWLKLDSTTKSICILRLLCCLCPIRWDLHTGWSVIVAFTKGNWKFKVMVMAKVTSYGYIWGIVFNWYIRFSLRGNQPIFAVI